MNCYAVTYRVLCVSTLVWIFAIPAGTSFVVAQLESSPLPTFDETFQHWPVQTKINGKVFINRNVSERKSLDRVFRRILKDSKLTISASKNDELGVYLGELATSLDSKLDYEQIALSVDQIREALGDGGLLYIGNIDSTPENLLNIRDDFERHIQQGGSLIFDFKYAHLLGSIVERQPATNGLNLFPDCLIPSDFDGSESAKEQLAIELGNSNSAVGIGIEDKTMLLLAGRSLIPFGTGPVTVAIANGEREKPKFASLIPNERRGQNSRIDLTQWRRMAIDRSLEPFPPKTPHPPLVENGTLYIVGGGGMPRGLMSEMIEKAGGVEHARLVYVPCSELDNVGERQGTVEMWKKMGVQNATFIHTKDRIKANSDDDFLEPLKDATMIWFGGGRQWNFADSYYGTKAHKLMKEVLHRGGVIGGSSAGASIQGRFLARSTPIGNTSILAPGYERGGLGFLSGVAIDQHFSQRGRQKDMTQLVEKYPQLLGIGIDEATALVVEKSKGKVIGRGKVFFYDRHRTTKTNNKDYIALSAGEVFDLAARRIVTNN